MKLCEPLTARHDDPVNYNPPPGLKEAVDVAMMLGEPIVLTGAPGAGKTQAAKWLAHHLNANEVLRFDVKSTTLGADLLYAFDDVARFRDAAAGRTPQFDVKPLVRYLRFNALGYGIVRAAGPNSVLWTVGGEELKGGDVIQRHRKLLDDAFGPGWQPTGDEVRVCDLFPDDADFRQPFRGREVRVVLIDELDKAPRDTPNDLLVEVENMTFLIAELGLRVKTDRKVRPIVVITSNAEKPLPEPFLRRCAYFDVPRVRGETLKAILQGSLKGRSVSENLINEVVEVADLLHSSQDAIHRKPGTAELLAWSEVLARLGAGSGLKAWGRKQRDQLAQSLTALLKQADDQRAGLDMITKWMEGARGRPREARGAALPDSPSWR
ncbi:hypothetical protein AS593_04190 [Caulobacter vibrioides]|nr:hypothetical protein AS593_04190 [Caulobacter vibrioides]